LENLGFTVYNYQEKIAVSRVHLEFKEKMNESLIKFIKNSGKFDNDISYLKKSMKIFQQYKDDFHNNYTSFLEKFCITDENY